MARGAAPSLSGLDGWQQSAPRSLTQLRGRVVVVWFYSRSAPGCRMMVPGLRALQERWGDRVQVIAIHSPQNARDADPQAVGLAAARAGMTWPIGLDHRRSVFARWHSDQAVQGWPATFVVDREGQVVSRHHGADVEPIRAVVESLLG